ncbi:MAG: ATP-binding protein [Pseudomonadota bacterium]
MINSAKTRTVLGLIYLLAGALLAAVVTLHAFGTVNQSFHGILPFENGYVGAFTQPSWEGGKLGLKYHDRIDALKLALSTLSSADVFSIFVPLAATGICFLLIGAFAFFIYPAPPGILPFLSYCGAAGVYFLTAYDFHTTYRFVPLLLITFTFIPATVIHLAVAFPKPIVQKKVQRLATLLAYLISVVIGIPYLSLFHSQPTLWVRAEYSVVAYLSAAYLLWTGVMIYRATRDPDQATRDLCRLLLVPLLTAFGLVFVAGWLVFVFNRAIPLNWIAPVCLIFPGAIAYAMLRRNLFFVDYLETQIQKRTQELNEATKLAAVGLLAAGTAHEIGNAMNLVSSNVPVLRKYADRLLALGSRASVEEKEKADFQFVQSDLPDLLSNLDRGAQRAMGIATDLKTFARPQASERGEIDLAEAIEATLRLLRTELGTRIAVKKQFSPSLPKPVGFPGQIHQVVLNLLLNAIQAIDGEGTIEIGVRAEGRQLIATIRDSGRGIPPEELNRIFEPFFTTKEKGTGLGLSVSYGIIAAHGGKLSVASAPGQGTIVTMVLPI